MADDQIPATDSPAVNDNAVSACRRPSEQRRWRRFPCSGFAEVSVYHPDTLFRGQIRDLSLHGCFVETRARVHPDIHAIAEIRFNLNNRQYKTPAVVMNLRQGEGVGFQFHFPSADAADQVQGLIDELLAVESRSDR
jgi:hypothetical protein